MSQKLCLSLWVVMVAAVTAVAGCQSNSAVLGSYSVGGQGGVGQAGSAGVGGGRPVYGSAVAIETLLAPGFTTTDPSVVGDGLELFFMSTRSGNKNLWHSRRTRLTDAWPTPELVSELNSDSVESNPKISEDGLRLWFYSDRVRASGTIWEASRASVSAAFSTPVAVPSSVAVANSEVAGCPNGDTTIALVSASIEGSTEGYDLLEMRRSSRSVSFGERTVLANVNSPEDDFDPWLSADGLLLVFHSNRLGSDDLFWAARSTVVDDFTAPTALTELNTSTYSEVAPSLAGDHQRIWFASTRDGGEEIYEAVAVE